ncbi:MAG TPA: hypothetical protein VK796_09165 [Cytophaga sp.]|jgi:hypothetical protein|nr:hypothetical protein [Cytophaga sp.]
MENCVLENDIQLLCVTAGFSEDGIEQAHRKLNERISNSERRKSFGISYVDDHGIVPYDAAVEVMQANEAEAFGLETFLLKKGNYMSLLVKGGRANRSDIGTAFSKMLFQKHADPEGYCIEWYLNDTDVQCMVRLTK